ncbi:hypothetical protein GCM10025876_16460 [Demequina litorisediminis]|uniref:phosphoribosylaminoimidazolesuccinocarboxamide synthase n=1 Tax=Demequina litorisediminis TaxID=1849022 RepID=A0ABQ6IC82_9MICO|nr:hypothetical protein GCM10025876_16460 [Demequina litorisediminis]
MLVVASDRISAYDWVLPTEIPGKGGVLTGLSLWWFDQVAPIVANHTVEAPVPAEVEGRAMVCKRLDMFPIECVARGYLTGSGLAEYRESGTVCGIPLPEGLVDGSRLPEPIFTPAAKAEVGEHDENIAFEQVVERIGLEDATALRDLTLAVYSRAHEARRRARRDPRGHQVRVWSRRRRRHPAGRRGAHPRFEPLLARRRVGARPRPAQASTSSLCATGSRRTSRAGTRRPMPRRPRFPRTWSSAPGSATSRRTTGSPGTKAARASAG